MGENLDKFTSIAFSLITTEVCLLLVLMFALKLQIINHATFLLIVLSIIYFMGLQTYKYIQHYDNIKNQFNDNSSKNIEVGGIKYRY